MIEYKIDILEELKKKGYSSTALRKEKLLPEKTIQAIREKNMVGIKSIERICMLLECQPGDLLAYKKTQERV